MGLIITGLGILFAAFAGVPLGYFLTVYFGWWAYPWLGPVIGFVIAWLAVNAVLGSVLAAVTLVGGGLWATTPMRWLVGKGALLLLLVPPVIGVFFVFHQVGLPTFWLVDMARHPLMAFVPFVDPRPDLTGWNWLVAQWLGPALRLVIFGGWVKGVLAFAQAAKPVVATITRPFRAMWKAVKTGLGGSAGIDGLLDEWLMPWKRGQVILGTSLYEPGQRLGKTDDRHLLTIATTRAGKGASCIIPNLLVYPGSVLVIDPKGENAAVTALARKRMGQDIHIIDPFGVMQALGLDAADYPAQRFNPLDAIGRNDLDVVEQINNLADALIVRADHGNPFWDNASHGLLAGIIAHVLAWPKLRDDERHLGTVRDYVTETNGRKLTDLAGQEGIAGLTAAAVSLLKGSESSASDVLLTLRVHVKWLDSVAMRRALEASDFDLASLKHRNASLYLVIPPRYLQIHSRFMRLFITVAMHAAGASVKADHPMLFIMDEFPTLGPLKIVEEAAGVLAGSGVRLWPIIQNLTQLRPYGDNWEVFLANAGQVQVFAMNDQATARYFSERLGHHMAWRKVKHAGKVEWVPQGATWLRTAAELARESARDSNRALVFYEGGGTAIMQRTPYWQQFASSDYEPNPYQKGKARIDWESIIDELERDGGKALWAKMTGRASAPAMPAAEPPLSVVDSDLPPPELPKPEPLKPKEPNPDFDSLWQEIQGQGADPADAALDAELQKLEPKKRTRKARPKKQQDLRQ